MMIGLVDQDDFDVSVIQEIGRRLAPKTSPNYDDWIC